MCRLGCVDDIKQKYSLARPGARIARTFLAMPVGVKAINDVVLEMIPLQMV